MKVPTTTKVLWDRKQRMVEFKERVSRKAGRLWNRFMVRLYMLKRRRYLLETISKGDGFYFTLVGDTALLRLMKNEKKIQVRNDMPKIVALRFMAMKYGLCFEYTEWFGIYKGTLTSKKRQ